MRLPFLNHKSKKGRIKNMKIQRDGKEYTLTAEEVMEAHEEFVTSFMVAELENSYDVPHKYSKDLAKEAYEKRHMICMLTAVFIPNMIASNVLQRTIRIAVKNLLLQ